MWEQIKQVIYSLFGIKLNKDDNNEDIKDIKAYQDTTKENFTAIFAGSLSTLAFGDSVVSIVLDKDKEPTKRVLLLNDTAKRMWKNIKQNIAVGNGCGLIASIPYVSNGKLHVDTVTKDRFYITSVQGEDITQCIVLSDVVVINNVKYCRWTDYQVRNNTYTIKQKATKNNRPCALSEVLKWSDITEEIAIQNVDKLPIGVYRCPTSNRRPTTVMGVPITYGCDSTLEKIRVCLDEIEQEFKSKKVKIFADNSLFDKNQKLTDTYVKIMSGGGLKNNSNIDIFDPAFRDTSYFNKLDRLFMQLEKEVGTSRGILTDLSVQGATATEIKRAMLQTFNLCDDIRQNTEMYFNDLIYGCNILANAFNLTAPSEYKVLYDWSYSMLEDSTESFNQLMQAKSTGAISTAEIRNFIRTSESMEESQKAVAEIAKNEPSLSNLIGE